jgi:uncharacterized RDD family membrane protein YckC
VVGGIAEGLPTTYHQHPTVSITSNLQSISYPLALPHMDEKNDVIAAEIIPAEPVQADPHTVDGPKTLQLGDPALRILAFVIDMAIYVVFAFALELIFGLSTTLLPLGGTSSNKGLDLNTLNLLAGGIGLLSICILPLLKVLFSVLYLIIVPTSVWPGQTLGMKLFNLKFLKENGSNVSTSDLSVRSIFLLLYNLPFVSLIICCILPILAIVNLILIFTDDKNQTLFDKMAGTIVVKE